MTKNDTNCVILLVSAAPITGKRYCSPRMVTIESFSDRLHENQIIAFRQVRGGHPLSSLYPFGLMWMNKQLHRYTQLYDITNGHSLYLWIIARSRRKASLQVIYDLILQMFGLLHVGVSMSDLMISAIWFSAFRGGFGDTWEQSKEFHMNALDVVSGPVFHILGASTLTTCWANICEDKLILRQLVSKSVPCKIIVIFHRLVAKVLQSSATSHVPGRRRLNLILTPQPAPQTCLQKLTIHTIQYSV